jgi:hypothetical protein
MSGVGRGRHPENGAGRYVVSIDDGWNFTTRAMKLPEGYHVRVLADHSSSLVTGTGSGLGNGAVLTEEVLHSRGAEPC